MHSMPNREPIPCVLVRLACENCGPVRMALASVVEPEAAECPYCDAESPLEVLGTGSTVRILPYFELESSLRQYTGHPPPTSSFRRLTRGQMVVFCQETSILHFAAVDEVWTNAASISSTGMPSVSFLIGGLETDPVPHVSGANDLPPFWCLPDEMPRPTKRIAGVQVASEPVTIRTPGRVKQKKKEQPPKKSPSAPLV